MPLKKDMHQNFCKIIHIQVKTMVMNLEKKLFTLYLIWQIWALSIRQQVKKCCQKYGQMGIQLSN